MAEKIVWGIIGAGNVCETKSGPAFYKIKHSEVKAIMRRNLEKAEDFAKRHQILFWYTDASEIFNDPEINAVYIATPPDTHAYYTFEAAKRGKAVYVEKPMARNYAECQEMIKACEKAGVPLFVAYYRRALPNFIKIKELVDGGAIGDIRTLNIEMYKPYNEATSHRPDLLWRVNPEISGGGLFHDLASHQFDILDFIFGPVKHATGISVNLAHQYAADDTVNAIFQFEKGITGTGTWNFSSSKFAETDKTTIIGSKGKIEFATFSNLNVLIYNEKGINTHVFERPQHIQQPLIETVVGSLLGKSFCPSTGITAARTSKILDEICKKF